MGETLLKLLALVVAGVFTPTQMLAVLLMLRSKRPVATAGAFVGGLTGLRVAICLVAVSFLHGVSWSERTRWEPAGGLAAPIGIVLLAAAAILFVRKPDPGAGTPRWLDTVASATPRAAFALGLGLMAISPRHWAIFIAGTLLVANTDLGLPAQVVLSLLFLALLQLLVLAPLALYLAAPHRAAALLGRIESGYAAYNRPIAIVSSTGFGALLLVTGMAGLLS